MNNYYNKMSDEMGNNNSKSRIIDNKRKSQSMRKIVEVDGKK